MRINTNISSLSAQEAMTQTDKSLNTSLERLSSGLRINKASDDASGLSIADKLRTQASSIQQSIDNANSGVALVQIADKAMAEQSNIVDIIKQKLTQAGTATTSTEGRTAISKDINKLLDQLNNIAKQTNYNGMALLQKSHDDAGATNALTFQVGETAADVLSTNGGISSNTTGLGLTGLKSVVSGDDLSQTAAQSFMDNMDEALNKLNSWRADYGSTQNQLESATRNMMTQHTNVKAAESIIRDVDYAQESANFNKLNIISQAGNYSLTQSNKIQENVLKLLQ